MHSSRSYILVFLFGLFTIIQWSCRKIDLYEKTVTIPGHSWKSSYKPSFAFTITDVSSPYRLFITLRHDDKYNYNNIYVNLITRYPDSDSLRTFRFDLPLATNEKGWLGSGMDDVYEHLLPLNPSGQLFRFPKPGEYVFTVEQIMREDPLEHVYNVGLRIEKQ